MAVDTNKCSKRFLLHLEGMSRRLKLLWGYGSSLERVGGFVQSEDQLRFPLMYFAAYIFSFFLFSCSNSFQEIINIIEIVMLSFGFLISEKNVWICQGQLHSAPHWMPYWILFYHLICLAQTAVQYSPYAGLIHTWHKSYTWKSSSIKIVCLGISRTNFFVFYVRWGSSNKEYLLQLLQLVKYCSCQWICQNSFFWKQEGSEPQQLIIFHKNQMNRLQHMKTGRETIKCWHQWVEKKRKLSKKKKKSKEEQLKSRTQQIIKLPQKKQHMFFSKQSFWSINPS